MLKGHSAPIASLAASEDLGLLCSADDDGKQIDKALEMGRGIASFLSFFIPLLILPMSLFSKFPSFPLFLTPHLHSQFISF